VRWMADEGDRDDYLLSLDFRTLGYGAIPGEMMDRIVPPIARFITRRTKEQLFDGAIERRILLFPVATLGDILADPQLTARDFFKTTDAPEFGAQLTTLGPFARASATPLKTGGRPPKLGEHNTDIYVNELKLTRDELVRLAGACVI